MFSLFLSLHLFLKFASSSETYCLPEEANIFCTVRATDETITQDDINTNSSALYSRAWVINTTVYLFAGNNYHPGNSVWANAPAIYIIGDGELVIYNQGWGTDNEIGLEGYIFLCDNAGLYIINSQVRSLQAFSFQYWMWSSGNSTILYQNSVIAMANEGIDGAWFQAMRQNTTIGVNNITTTNGAWEFAVIDNALG